MGILEWCHFFSQHYKGLSVPYYLINNVHTSALGSPHTPTAQEAWQVGRARRQGGGSTRQLWALHQVDHIWWLRCRLP